MKQIIAIALTILASVAMAEDQPKPKGRAICGGCKKVVAFFERDRGKRARCLHCKSVIRLPLKKIIDRTCRGGT